MRNLYDITNDLDIVRERVFQEAEENDGVIPDYIGDLLDSIEGERTDKIQKIAEMYKDLIGFSDSIAKEQKRLTKMKSTYSNEQERIKEYLTAFVDEGEKIKSATSTVSWRKSSSVNVLVDPTKLPEEFQKVVVSSKKTDIKNAIKAGVDLSEYANIVTSTNISIK